MESWRKELYHHGILGMKWGVRRYQNADGSLTSAGRRRYGSMSSEKLRDTITKQVRDERIKQARGEGLSRFSSKIQSYNIDKGIGKESTKVLNEMKKSQNNTDYEIKTKQARDFDNEWIRRRDEIISKISKTDKNKNQAEYSKLIKEFDSLDESYAKKSEKLWAEVGKTEFKNMRAKYSKELFSAYMKDLNYNQESIDFVTSRINNYDEWARI